MEMSPEEFTRLLDRIVQAIAEMPLVDNADLTADDYILLKDNSTNQPKKVSITQIGTVVSTVLDADLAAIAALSPSNDDILQRKSGAWTNRTIAQLLTDLAVVRLTTDQTVAGNKTLTGQLILSGASTNFIRPVAAAVSAFGGGGQASATQLTGMLARVSVCGTNGDSVKLPVSVAGMTYKLKNDGTQACHVFAAVGESMNGTANGYVPVAGVGGYVEFECVVTGAWRSIATNTNFRNTIIGQLPVGNGLLTIRATAFTKTFSGGATETVSTGVPVGSVVLGIQMRNDTVIVCGGGGVAFSSTFDGAAVLATTSLALTKNTKSSRMQNMLTATDGDIIFTPDAGTLDSGTVSGVVYHYEMVDITDAP